jgi:hypothetical protein
MLAKQSGIYIVVLKNTEPISTYAGDKRRVNCGTLVGLGNLKVGKATNLKKRYNNYVRTFGEHNFDFNVLALLDNIDEIEKLILKELTPYRVRSIKGRLLEWLSGISKDDAIKLVTNIIPCTSL